MKRLLIGLIFGAFLALGFLTPVPAFAQTQPVDGVCSSVTGPEKPAVCQAQDVEVVGSDGVIVRAARLVGVVTAVASVLAIMVGGFKYIISAGDPSNVNSAKNTIMYAIIGLVISIIAPILLGFALSFF